MSDDTLTRLEAIFCETFGDHCRGKITDQTTMEDVEEWDSFSFIDLLMTVEERFGVKFEPDEMTEMYRVGAIREAIERKRG